MCVYLSLEMCGCFGNMKNLYTVYSTSFTVFL